MSNTSIVGVGDWLGVETSVETLVANGDGDIIEYEVEERLGRGVGQVLESVGVGLGVALGAEVPACASAR